ncbi:hypothetical protein AVEN_161793-1 [Araneus ventricosus]|uniref:Uncharacterized protein n=1 Tax=Araneus ventricosus TaxID=182803 RepID=A0A4Y2PSA0_ARAVE|nr:hypothetical protein AVEN_175503-1 [Araneus ventricosus]GBN53137.1 hypothetical protein AVEN_161793-1 [Araneus ventricosus]
MFGCPAKMGLSSSIIPQSLLYSINIEADLEKLEDSQETVIMGWQSNLTQKDIPLSPASAESPIEIQEFIDSNLKLPSAPLIEVSINGAEGSVGKGNERNRQNQTKSGGRGEGVGNGNERNKLLHFNDTESVNVHIT